MQELFSAEPIRSIEIFYYSSPNHIFMNTTLIEMLNSKYLPENVKIKTTQIPQPSHHDFGQAPFLCINQSHIVKRPQLWQLIISVLNVNPERKYEFLSVAYLTEEIAEVSSIFSDFDQNPYFVFISPWKKYKRHHNLENKKHWFRDNSLFWSTKEDSLNKEHFIYKTNSLGALIEEYQKEYEAKPQNMKFLKIMVFAMLKHLKMVQKTLYLVSCEVEALKKIQEEVQLNMEKGNEQNIQRAPIRNIPFMNVNLKYLQKNPEEKEKQQPQNGENHNEREKTNQYVFKPILTTAMFVLAMLAFK